MMVLMLEGKVGFAVLSLRTRTVMLNWFESRRAWMTAVPMLPVAFRRLVR